MAHTLPLDSAWSARCGCMNNHRSASGKCSCRSTRMPDGTYEPSVIDPTRFKGDVAICEDCRKNCPVGVGNRVEWRTA
jgi:hypothetical protein